MSNQIVLPVSAAELSKTEIENAVKISKQVIMEQLKTQRAALMEQYSVVRDANAEAHGIIRKKLDKEIEASFKLLVANDSDFSALRKSVNTFTKLGLKNNFDLISDLGTARALHYLQRGDNAKDLQKKLFTKGVITVDYTLLILFPDSKENIRNIKEDGFDKDYFNSDYDLEIDVSTDFIDGMKKIIADNQQIYDINIQVNDIDKKMKELPLNLEKLEASILVKELQGSERGKEILNITSGIVKDILGGTPDLLQLGN